MTDSTPAFKLHGPTTTITTLLTPIISFFSSRELTWQYVSASCFCSLSSTLSLFTLYFSKYIFSWFQMLPAYCRLKVSIFSHKCRICFWDNDSWFHLAGDHRDEVAPRGPQCHYDHIDYIIFSAPFFLC